MINTVNCKRSQTAFFHKIHASVKQIFKVVPHTEKLQSYGL